MWDYSVVCLLADQSHICNTASDFAFVWWSNFCFLYESGSYNCVNLVVLLCENISLESEAEVGRFEARSRLRLRIYFQGLSRRAKFKCTSSLKVSDYIQETQKRPRELCLVRFFTVSWDTRSQHFLIVCASYILYRLNSDGEIRVSVGYGNLCALYCYMYIDWFIKVVRLFNYFRDLQLTEPLIEKLQNLNQRLEKTILICYNNECVYKWAL